MDHQTMNGDMNSIDVLNLDKLADNPYCKHGPTILFKNGKKTYYSCSACRDHKLCNFYFEFNENKKPSDEKMRIWFDRYKIEFDEFYEEQLLM
jgi:hypothetical protein